jgi:release factor glutamine methyltransferase
MCDANPPQERRVRRLLSWATARIRACLEGATAGSADTPYLDALLLLSLASGEPTERLMAFLPDELPERTVLSFAGLVEERCAGTPVSYIRGTKEFYGREFVVSPAVLVPRPDTETLVETVLELLDAWDGSPPHLHDACTGSGCIAVTLAAEAPTLQVTASDVSDAALAVARRNAERLVGADRVGIWLSDLLDRLPGACTARGLVPPRIITANPPYLTDTEYEAMRDSGWPEPGLALAAGADGLDYVRRLAAEAVTQLAPDGYLVVEIGPAQGESGTEIVSGCGFAEVTVRKDLAGRDRVLIARR